MLIGIIGHVLFISTHIFGPWSILIGRLKAPASDRAHDHFNFCADQKILESLRHAPLFFGQSTAVGSTVIRKARTPSKQEQSTEGWTTVGRKQK